MNSIFWGIIFILLQGFFSGSETAAIMSDRLKLITMKRKGMGRARRALFVIENMDAFIISMLSFTNICVVLSSTFITNFFVSIYGSMGTSVAIVITVSLSLLVGEYIPKLYAQSMREKILLTLSPLYQFLTYPFVFFSKIKKKKEIYPLSKEDILSLIKEGERRGTVVDRGTGIAYNILFSKNIKVEEIMTPIEMVKAIPYRWTIKEIKKIVKKYRFSRYPVYKKEVSNIVGIIHLKDVVYHKKKIIRKPIFVETKDRILDALMRLQKARQMMGIVRNGSVAVGIVTMEDLIEEIVGEIRSES